MAHIKEEIQRILKPADIQLNGERPWDIRVHSDDFFPRVYAGGSIALGESYMDGWWDCDALDQFFQRILDCRIDQNTKVNGKCLCKAFLKTSMMNLQNIRRAFIVGKRHYDTGNDLFAQMLDKRMNYSCGYWKEADDLDAAQEAKLELICRKIQLAPKMEVLDIGCGWGGFVKYAAETRGAKVHGITVSKEQAHYATESCKGLDVRIDLMDYRKADKKYDAIVSVGMFEHEKTSCGRCFFPEPGLKATADATFTRSDICCILFQENPIFSIMTPWTIRSLIGNLFLDFRSKNITIYFK